MARNIKNSAEAVVDGLTFSKVNDDPKDDTAELIKKLTEEKEKAEREVRIAKKEAEVAKKNARGEAKSKHVQILITPTTYEKIKNLVESGKVSSMNQFINDAITDALSK